MKTGFSKSAIIEGMQPSEFSKELERNHFSSLLKKLTGPEAPKAAEIEDIWHNQMGGRHDEVTSKLHKIFKEKLGILYLRASLGEYPEEIFNRVADIFNLLILTGLIKDTRSKILTGWLPKNPQLMGKLVNKIISHRNFDGFYKYYKAQKANLIAAKVVAAQRAVAEIKVAAKKLKYLMRQNLKSVSVLKSSVQNFKRVVEFYENRLGIKLEKNRLALFDIRITAKLEKPRIQAEEIIDNATREIDATVYKYDGMEENVSSISKQKSDPITRINQIKQFAINKLRKIEDIGDGQKYFVAKVNAHAIFSIFREQASEPNANIDDLKRQASQAIRLLPSLDQGSRKRYIKLIECMAVLFEVLPDFNAISILSAAVPKIIKMEEKLLDDKKAKEIYFSFKKLILEPDADSAELKKKSVEKLKEVVTNKLKLQKYIELIEYLSGLPKLNSMETFFRRKGLITADDILDILVIQIHQKFSKYSINALEELLQFLEDDRDFHFGAGKKSYGLLSIHSAFRDFLRQEKEIFCLVDSADSAIEKAKTIAAVNKAQQSFIDKIKPIRDAGGLLEKIKNAISSVEIAAKHRKEAQEVIQASREDILKQEGKIPRLIASANKAIEEAKTIAAINKARQSFIDELKPIRDAGGSLKKIKNAISSVEIAAEYRKGMPEIFYASYDNPDNLLDKARKTLNEAVMTKRVEEVANASTAGMRETLKGKSADEQSRYTSAIKAHALISKLKNDLEDATDESEIKELKGKIFSELKSLREDKNLDAHLFRKYMVMADRLTTPLDKLFNKAIRDKADVAQTIIDKLQIMRLKVNRSVDKEFKDKGKSQPGADELHPRAVRRFKQEIQELKFYTGSLTELNDFAKTLTKVVDDYDYYQVVAVNLWQLAVQQTLQEAEKDKFLTQLQNKLQSADTIARVHEAAVKIKLAVFYSDMFPELEYLESEGQKSSDPKQKLYQKINKICREKITEIRENSKNILSDYLDKHPKSREAFEHIAKNASGLPGIKEPIPANILVKITELGEEGLRTLLRNSPPPKDSDNFVKSPATSSPAMFRLAGANPKFNSEKAHRQVSSSRSLGR